MILKLYKKILLGGLLLTAPALLQAQVTINFNAAVYGQSLEGLSQVQIFNSSVEDVLASVTIKINENSTGNVLTATFVAVPLHRGINTIDRTAFSRGRFIFSSTYNGVTLSQTGRFPEGEYEYCFEAEITDSKSPWVSPFFENCFVQNVQPLTPLLLINPPDEEESCNSRPSFLWQLPIPLPPVARCRLVLTEIKDKQDIAEAINYNIPLINQGNIPGNQLIFPGSAPSLKEDKRYAWQVTVYTGNAILKKSEIWVYTVKCDKEAEDFATDSYRELKENQDGAFYITGKFLRFSFYNPYGGGDLVYSIVDLAKPGDLIGELPSLKLLPGLNKYDLDLSEAKAFKNGHEYRLKVKLVNNRELWLRFLFKTDN